jgi:hypothetical protein
VRHIQEIPNIVTGQIKKRKQTSPLEIHCHEAPLSIIFLILFGNQIVFEEIYIERAFRNKRGTLNTCP